MTRKHQLLGLALAGLTLTGCVPNEKYNALKLDRDSLRAQLDQAAAEAAAANARAATAESQFGQLAGGANSQTAMISNLTQQNQALQRQYDDAMRRLEDALSRQGGIALPEELSNELSEFAKSNPDLVEFDAERGIVKFKSDVTFATGDAALQPQAVEAINRFAAILNSSAAQGYELLVAGHTDNQRVSNPATIQKGHKNNWYLSSHRAISVADALMAQKVSAQRIGVVGYGEERPIASNQTNAGRAQNRRVEVLILPTQIRNQNVAAAPGEATPAAAAELNKDGTSAAPAPAPAPALNK